MSERRDPEKTFFMVVTIGNCDGTLEVENMCEGTFETEAEAVNNMKDQCERGEDLESVVFEVKPIWRTKRHYKTICLKDRKS